MGTSHEYHSSHLKERGTETHTGTLNNTGYYLLTFTIEGQGLGHGFSETYKGRRKNVKTVRELFLFGIGATTTTSFYLLGTSFRWGRFGSGLVYGSG